LLGLTVRKWVGWVALVWASRRRARRLLVQGLLAAGMGWFSCGDAGAGSGSMLRVRTLLTS